MKLEQVNKCLLCTMSVTSNLIVAHVKHNTTKLLMFMRMLLDMMLWMVLGCLIVLRVDRLMMNHMMMLLYREFRHRGVWCNDFRYELQVMVAAKFKVVK